MSPKLQAIKHAAENTWQEHFKHLSSGEVTFTKKMRVALPGDELVRRNGGGTMSNPKRYRYWCVGSYSVRGGGGYIAVRNDGKLVTMAQVNNLDLEKRKSELYNLAVLVQDACSDPG